MTTKAPTETKVLGPRAVQDVMAAMAVASIPDVVWIIGDDECDCTFQRIGDWTNSYLGQTLRVRLCCIWAEIYKQYPQFVQEIPAHFDRNRWTYVTEPAEWDSDEMDMPVSLWHRQLAKQQGKSLAEIRAEYKGRENERPKRVTVKKAKQPTKAELAFAKESELRAAQWLV